MSTSVSPLWTLPTHYRDYISNTQKQHFLDIGPLRLSDGEDITPRTSPAQSDESLLAHEIDQKPRIVYPDSPEPLHGHKPLRVAVIQTACGLPAPSGGYRGNYATLMALQKYGHETMQTCWAYSKEIQQAIAELKAANKYDAKSFEHGTVFMLNSECEKVKVQYWKFKDIQGILCVALDAESMIPTFPNAQQQIAASRMIMVCHIIYCIMATANRCRLRRLLPKPSHMSSGFEPTLLHSNQHTFSSTTQWLTS